MPGCSTSARVERYKYKSEYNEKYKIKYSGKYIYEPKRAPGLACGYLGNPRTRLTGTLFSSEQGLNAMKQKYKNIYVGKYKYRMIQKCAAIKLIPRISFPAAEL